MKNKILELYKVNTIEELKKIIEVDKFFEE